MTKIGDLKGSKRVEQSSSLPEQLLMQQLATRDSDTAVMGKINQTFMDWGKNIFPRMDDDERLWTMEPYRLVDANGEDLEDVEHVTMNDARVFGERVLAVLNESEELIEINGQRDGKELDTKQTKIIEDFYHDNMYIANERQNDILMPDLDVYWWEQIAIRGRVGARILLSQDEHGYEPDIVPIDMRKCVYGVGRWGLAWVAFWDALNKEEVKDEYPEYQMKGDIAIRWDYWSPLEEVIFLDNGVFEALPNGLHHPPFVIQLCQQGTFLDTTHRALRMRGDSIYSADRDLYPHLNKIASILQTDTMLSSSPPQKMKSKSGKKLPAEPVYRRGRVLGLEIGEDIQKIEAPDIIAATRFFMATLMGAIQRGSISHIDWGNLTFQLSQVAIATLAGASRQVFSPRLRTMERFKRKVEREIRSQFIMFDMEADIGRTGSKRTYTKTDLMGDFTVDFEYFTTLPEETAAAYGLANMAKGWMDDASIRKTILKYRDAADMTEKVLVQQARQVSRALALFQMAVSLDVQGHKDEAKILLIEVGQTLEGKVGQEVARLTGTEIPGVSPADKAVIPQTGAPPSEAPRTTRKTERPGVGEFEEEEAGA